MFVNQYSLLEKNWLAVLSFIFEQRVLQFQYFIRKGTFQSPQWLRQIVVLTVFPRVADLLGKCGVQFTSPEFEFFRRVVNYTIETRSRTGSWRGDFLDLLEDTKSERELV